MNFPAPLHKAMVGLFNMGVTSEVASSPNGSPAQTGMDVRKAKRIILSNQISLSIAILNLPYVLIYPFMGKGILGWLEILLFLGYASVHRLNGAGHNLFSRLFLITLANLDILTYTLALGRGTGMHFLFLLSAWAPLLLFDLENRKSLIFGIGLSSACFLGSEIYAPLHGLDPLTLNSERALFLVTLLTTVLVQFLFAAYFFTANRRTESSLTQAREAAMSADQAKSRFLDSMGREIGIPLKVLQAAEEALRVTGLSPEEEQTIQDIRSSTADLTQIVDGILDISQIEAGRMRLDPAPFDLQSLIHAILRPIEYEAKSRGLEIALEFPEAISSLVIGDASRLKQVLRNLLGNALKFTHQGSISLRIKPTRAGTISFEIEDTGIGIPAEVQARVFEPFFQADGSTSRKYGGTGLGLFITNQIVELMGGTIGFRPGNKSGSVFAFTIPLPAIPAKSEMVKP